MARSFFDATKGEGPASTAKQRQLAYQIGLGQTPRNFGEGLSAVGRALIARQMLDEAKATDVAGRESAAAQWAALFGGGGDALGGAASSMPQEAAVQPNMTVAPDMMVPTTPEQVAPAPSPAPVQSMDPILDTEIERAAQRHGVNPNLLRTIAQLESGGDTSAQNPNSSASGPFQFIDSTAQQYGVINPFDPEMASDAAARLTRDNARVLAQQLGREPTEAELYLAHQQGATGAANLLANPEARAVDIVGPEAVRLNGGNENMTAGQFAEMWMQRAGLGQPQPMDVVTQALANREMQQRAPQQTSSMPTTAPLSPIANGIFGGAPGASIEQLATLAANPYLSDGQRTVLNAMLQQQIQAQDPMRRLQMRKLEQDLTTPKRDPESERRIEALMRRGQSREQAENTVYGFEQVITDPTLQAPVIVDRTTGQGRPVDVMRPQAGGVPGEQPAATGQPTRTLYGQTDVATGAVPTAQDLWNRIGPQVGLPGFEGVSEARQQFNLANRELIRALSVNPRFPVGEMQAIEREINLSPSAFDSPESMRERMRAVDSDLRRRIENERRVANDPGMPSEQRRNALAAISNMQNYLSVLGVPQDQEGMEDSQNGDGWMEIAPGVRIRERR